MKQAIKTAWLLPALLCLAACATSNDPHREMTHAERMSLQNDCTRIADRSERQRCLDQAATGQRNPP